MEEYLIPAAEYSLESRVANSKFIATISPAFSVDAAKVFIAAIENKYSDATHNVPVYLIGFGATQLSHSSDNGEPSGTAGRPALSVLMGSGLGDTVLVITRYFGGTKLGTGGLVKAYSDAARGVIKKVPKAYKIFAHHAYIECPYNLYEIIVRKITNQRGKIIEEEFAENVKLKFSFPVNMYDDFTNSIINLSNGKINPEITTPDQVSLVNTSGKID